MLGPVENDHGGSDFGQAADLAFVVLLLLADDVASLRINNDVSLRAERTASGPKREDEAEKGEKTRERSHNFENRCTLSAEV
jgi:hypothetical protein